MRGSAINQPDRLMAAEPSPVRRTGLPVVTFAVTWVVWVPRDWVLSRSHRSAVDLDTRTSRARVVALMSAAPAFAILVGDWCCGGCAGGGTSSCYWDLSCSPWRSPELAALLGKPWNAVRPAALGLSVPGAVDLAASGPHRRTGGGVGWRRLSAAATSRGGTSGDRQTSSLG